MEKTQLTRPVYLIGIIWLVLIGVASIWVLARPHRPTVSLSATQISQNPPVSPVNDRIKPPLSEKNLADNRFPQLAQEVTRRLSIDPQPYIFTDDQLNRLREHSRHCAPLLSSSFGAINQTHLSQIVQVARREGLEPGLIVYIALAEWIEKPGQDLVLIGIKVITTIGPLANRYGVELVDKSLLLIAAYHIAQTGNSPHVIFRERLTGSLANETGRTIWAIHRAGKISTATLTFTFRALAIGCVVQNPAFWGISEIPLVIA